MHRRVIWRRCSIQCWTGRSGCAALRSARSADLDGESFQAVGLGGIPEAYAEFCRNSRRLWPARFADRANAGDGADVVHIDDVAESESYHNDRLATRALVELGGARTCWPLRCAKDGELLGISRSIARRYGRSPTGRSSCCENFAAQAVIAMENARLITEQRRHWSSRPRPPRCCRSSTPRPATLRRCSMRCWKRRYTSATPPIGHFRTYDGEGFPLAAVCGDAKSA